MINPSLQPPHLQKVSCLILSHCIITFMMPSTSNTPCLLHLTPLVYSQWVSFTFICVRYKYIFLFLLTTLSHTTQLQKVSGLILIAKYICNEFCYFITSWSCKPVAGKQSNFFYESIVNYSGTFFIMITDGKLSCLMIYSLN